ncbi:hypothetical protein V2J09_004376 [Rumex salicifolius]
MKLLFSSFRIFPTQRLRRKKKKENEIENAEGPSWNTTDPGTFHVKSVSLLSLPRSLARKFPSTWNSHLWTAGFSPRQPLLLLPCVLRWLIPAGKCIMILQNCASMSKIRVTHTKSTNNSSKVPEDAHFQVQEISGSDAAPADVDIDLREVYFLILHFLSAGPCQKTFRQLCDELLDHQLLPRRYHAWYSRSSMHHEDKNDDGISFPLSYEDLIQRYSHIPTDHLVKLLKQLLVTAPYASAVTSNCLNAADIPTLLGTGSFSLLRCMELCLGDRNEKKKVKRLPDYLRWPHMKADQVHGLSLRAIGGGFTRHHRAPSIHAASHAIAKPSTMIQKMQNTKKIRGHRNAVYCAIFDRSGRYVITGSDDRLVKIWSMETAFCLASCRGHEGDITDLAVSSHNTLVASASNDFVIRVWRLPDGIPISVLQGHKGAVTAIAFNPRTTASCAYQLLSSSDDGTCRIWDARNSQNKPRIYEPRRVEALTGRSNNASSGGAQQNNQILCCAFNANGTIFVTGSSDTLARVWSTCKSSFDDSAQPNHEMDILSGHENDVNYVQFSGCAVTQRSSVGDALKEDNVLKFRNSWLSHDNIVTCSRDGSAIIWIPRSRKSHGKVGRWMKAYHLKVPPPPLPPQPPRGGPRQRILPTPRGVNMIVWSLDNRFVLAAIMDCRICVWNAADGSLVHSLTGHTESTYVLDVHPFNPRIAMSAGYDGKTIIWDIWEGTPVRIFEIGRYKLVDGKFSQDGTSIVLSDEVGQIYLLSTGEGESQKDAKYDQFFLGDYRPLVRDNLGNVLDQETQLAPHRRNFQDLLCDSCMIPYDEPYQSALGIEWRPISINFATGPDFSIGEDIQMMPILESDTIFDIPEILDVSFWEPENEVGSDNADSEYNASEEYASGRERESLSASSYSDTDSDMQIIEVEQNENDGRRRSKRKKVEYTNSGRHLKRKNLEGSSSQKLKIANKSIKKRPYKASASRPKRFAARNAMSALSQMSETDSDGEDMDGFDSDSSESLSLEESNPQIVEPVEEMKYMENGGNKRRLLLKFSIRDSNKSLLPGVSSQKCDDLDKPGPSFSSCAEEDKSIPIRDNPISSYVNTADMGQNKNINRIKFKFKGISDQVVGHSGTSLNSEDNNSIGEGKVGSTENLTSEIMKGHKLVESDFYYEDHHRNISLATENAVSGNKPRMEELPGLIGNDLICNGNEPHDVKENAQPSTTKLKIRYGKMAEKRAPQVSEYRGDNLPESETDAARRSRSTEINPSSREANTMKYKLKQKKIDEVQEGTSSPPNHWSSSSKTLRSNNRQGSVHGDEPRSLFGEPNSFVGKISWLMMYEQEPGYRYIPQCADEVVYLRQGHEEYIEKRGSRERGPWLSMKGKLNAVEACLVEGLEYATVPSGESCCKITLKFTDPSSNVWGKTFRLTLPELVDFPDFLVEKHWYDSAVSRKWCPREKCVVWWRDGVVEGGRWWEGEISYSEPKSAEFPDSPWERYAVEYKDVPGEIETHSPWELHDADFGMEHPHLDFKVRDEILFFFTKLEKPLTRSQDSFGIQKLNQVSIKSDFMNRFPVPISPRVIQLRLEHNYYRRLEAVKHDIDVMISNASVYFGRNTEFSSKMKRLSGYLNRNLSAL